MLEIDLPLYLLTIVPTWYTLEAMMPSRRAPLIRHAHYLPRGKYNLYLSRMFNTARKESYTTLSSRVNLYFESLSTKSIRGSDCGEAKGHANATKEDDKLNR